ncbi:polysaccharide deacetylase family protein [Lutibacter sp.]|uniref:polysaccharide deacetylase family protein n=1 Tax=Lutibacter sp. TaxID=1925666 RepID=UPI003567E6C6
MKPYFIKTPSFLKLFFNNWAWSFSRKNKVIYLTFDDGPTPEITTWVLKELAKYNAEATFFCIGKNIQENTEIYQKIIEAKHSIGNHTFNHLNGWKTTTYAYINDCIKTTNFINNTSKLFRPPYGKLSLSQSKKLRKQGYKIIMWDVLSADFDLKISPEKCLENVVRNTENGSIIVFHDSLKAKEKLYYVLPKILEYYSHKGYSFKKIT